MVVQKRYSDFEKLRELLVRAHSGGPNPQTLGLPELPEKRLLGPPVRPSRRPRVRLTVPPGETADARPPGKFKAKVVEERRLGLESLLLFVLKNQVLSQSPVTVAWFKTSA